MDAVLSRGRDVWSRLGGSGRTLVVGLAVAAVAAAFFTVRAGAPVYVPMPGQPLDAVDTAAVIEKLGELQIPYRQGADGQTILVPRDRLLDSRLALAQAGVPRGVDGLELFDAPRLGATDFDRRVLLLRALQGELSRAITGMAPVQSATVKLAIPERSVFVREQKPVKAAVLVEPRRGRDLSAAEVEGIVRFLAWSVPELDPENVMVVDQTGRVLAAGLRDRGDAGLRAADQVQATLAFQQELEQKLQTMLERTLGPGNVTVMASVTLDFERTRQERLVFEPGGTGGQPLKRSEETRSEFFEGTGSPAAAQAAGSDANTLNPPSYQATSGESGNSTYERSETATNWELNEVRTVVESAPGRVQSVSVGVLINQGVLPTGSGAAMDQIQEVVAKAVGTPVANVTVATLPFQNDLVRALQAPPPEVAAASPWPLYGAVGAGAALLLAALFWLGRRQRQPLTGTGPLHELPQPAAAGLEAAAAREPSDAEREEAAERELAERMELLGEDFLKQLGLDPQRKRLQTEVEKLATQHPDLTAALLQTWLREDK